MSEVKALTQMDNLANGKFDVVEREMQQLTAQAKELGATTIYTAQEVGEAQAYIARTGWNTQQILGSTPVFLKLAASQHMNIALTADLATNIMTAFGHNMQSVGNDADKFAKVIAHDADVFAYTVTHSNQNFEQFGEAMSYAAPVARLFGATIEETAMMTKFMADAGIQGSRAGTSMRQTMLRLVAPPKKASAAMEKYGITLDDANAAWLNANAVAKEYNINLDENATAGRQFISIMEQIDKNMAGASDKEKLAAFSAITGVYAVSGAANLFGAGANQARNFTELLEHCAGALEQTYQVMTDNTYGTQKSFESAWEAVQLSAGESLSGITKSGYEFLTPILTNISKFIDAYPTVVQAAAAIAVAFGGLLISATAVKLAFAGWSFITAQIGLVRAAIASLADGVIMEGVAGRIAALTASIKGLTLSGAISAATGAMRGLGVAILSAARAALLFAISPIGLALMAIGLAGYYAYTHWDRVAPVLNDLATTISGAISPAIDATVQSFDKLFQTLGQAFDSKIFQGFVQAISDLTNAVGGGLVGAFIMLAGVVASVLSGIVVCIAGLVKTIADLGTDITKAIYQFSEGNYSAGFKALADAGSNAAENFKSAWADAFGAIGAVKSGMKGTAQAIETLTHPDIRLQHEALASHKSGGIGAIQAQISQIDAGQIKIDTSATQANVNALGVSAQNAATSVDGVKQAGETLSQLPADFQPTTEALSALPANLEPVKTEFANFPTTLEPTKTALAEFPASLQPAQEGLHQLSTTLPPLNSEAQNLSTNIQTDNSALVEHSAALQSNSAALQANIGALQAFGSATEGAIGGVTTLGTSAGSAASSVMGLGLAAQNACSQLVAAGANAAAQVSAAAASINVKSNYEGGIYRKGAFLTTFAEKSPEAAIPIDRSKRAERLWLTVGHMLGLVADNAVHDEHLQSALDTEQIKNAARIRKFMPTHQPKRARNDIQTKLITAIGVKLGRLADKNLPSKIFHSKTLGGIAKAGAGFLIGKWLGKFLPKETFPQDGTNIFDRYPFPLSTPPTFPEFKKPRLPKKFPFKIMSPGIPQPGKSPYKNKIPDWALTPPICFPTGGTTSRNNGSLLPQLIPPLIPKISGGLGKLIDKALPNNSLGNFAKPILGYFAGKWLGKFLPPDSPPPFALSESGGEQEGRLGKLLNINRQDESGFPTINLTLNLTINGNADAEIVQRGVESAVPTLTKSLDVKLRDWKREQLRRSFQ